MSAFERHGLSLVERLEAAVDIGLGAYGLTGYDLVPLEAIARDVAIARWAKAHVERTLAVVGESQRSAGSQATVLLFLALVRNDVPLDPRWDSLLPVHCNKGPKHLIAIWRAVPDARRDAVLVARLDEAYRPYAAAALLAEELGSRAAARWLLERIDKFDDPPRAKVRAIAAAIDPALVKRTRMVRLGVARRFAPSLADLSPVARKQLLAAMKRYDEKKLPLEARLGDGDYETTGSVQRGLERIEIEGDVAIEGFLYMGDSGTFFRKGTTRVVAEVIQSSLECRDAALGSALRTALGQR
jgi:hypothetical protein